MKSWYELDIIFISSPAAVKISSNLCQYLFKLIFALDTSLRGPYLRFDGCTENLMKQEKVERKLNKCAQTKITTTIWWKLFEMFGNLPWHLYGIQTNFSARTDRWIAYFVFVSVLVLHSGDSHWRCTFWQFATLTSLLGIRKSYYFRQMTMKLRGFNWKYCTQSEALNTFNVL